MELTSPVQSKHRRLDSVSQGKQMRFDSHSEEINRLSWDSIDRRPRHLPYIAREKDYIYLLYNWISDPNYLVHFRSDLLFYFFRLMTLKARRIFSAKAAIFPVRLSIKVYFDSLLTFCFKFTSWKTNWTFQFQYSKLCASYFNILMILIVFYVIFLWFLLLPVTLKDF